MPATEEQRHVFPRPVVHAAIDKPEYLAQFLIAEYAHIADSLLRNEEEGETRATFFVTIVGIVGTVLVTGLDTNAVAKALNDNVQSVLTLLLLFGVVTLLRIIRRNIVTDEYLRALGGLRRCFVSQKDAPGVLQYDPYEAKPPRFGHRLFGVGWAQVMALVNAGLVFGLVSSGPVSSRPGTGIAVLAAVVVFLAQVMYARWRRWKEQRSAYENAGVVIA